MRLAVISDIHGNLAALEAVLAGIKSRGVDAIVNLGDCCTGPLWPRQSLELLEACAIPSVRGNHDRVQGEGTVARAYRGGEFTFDNLSAEQRLRLANLPASLELDGSILAVHGTPASDSTYLLEDKIEGRLALATPATLGSRLAGITAGVVLCGHSHNQHVAWAPGGKLVVNPGSVGCPLYANGPDAPRTDARAPHARYAILKSGARGRYSADLILLEYDWEAAAARAIATGHPEWAPVYTDGHVKPIEDRHA